MKRVITVAAMIAAGLVIFVIIQSLQPPVAPHAGVPVKHAPAPPPPPAPIKVTAPAPVVEPPPAPPTPPQVVAPAAESPAVATPAAVVPLPRVRPVKLRRRRRVEYEPGGPGFDCRLVRFAVRHFSQSQLDALAKKNAVTPQQRAAGRRCLHAKQ